MRPPPEVVAIRREERKRAKRARKQGLDGSLPSVRKRCANAQRFAMRVSYDGSGFHGWQKIPQDKAGRSLPTIQGTLSGVLREILQQQVRLCPSGRTDAAVSARFQMVQFDLHLNERLAHRLSRSDNGWRNIPFETDTPRVKIDVSLIQTLVNERLPDAIRIISIGPVPMTFDVMKPLWKRYEYIFPVGEEERGKSFCVSKLLGRESNAKLMFPPNIGAMRDAAAILVGTHDFAAFQSQKGRKANSVRSIFSCVIKTATNHDISFQIIGSGFLMHMVRIIAGTLLEVGCGLRSQRDGILKGLNSKKREDAGPKLPGVHLTLDHVEYEKPFLAASNGERNSDALY